MALCTDACDMQISSEAVVAPGYCNADAGAVAAVAEPCRFPKLEECAHFHYERVQLPQTLTVQLQNNMDQSLHSQHTNENEDEFFMVQVTSGDECWLLQRNLENFKLLDAQLHQCIYDRKISQLTELADLKLDDVNVEAILISYLNRFSDIADNSLNCGPVLNWLQMDNKGHRLLVPSEESRSINTPAVAAAYSVRRYVSQALDELNLEVGDMISVIDMASPGESMWWRGKRGFQVGFFPQHCVHIIGDKVPRNMPLPPPVVGSLAISPIKPVLRKHGKLIAFFRSFILNRPSRRRLKQSGILKERVFGCDLGEHLLNSGHDIPTVLKCCAEFIEQNGIVDGIYRLSGITSNIQKLRNAFDEDRIPNLHTEDILQDIHSVASLLKMYFRELPNPLCTYQLYQSFVNAVQGCNNTIRNSESDRERLLKMREAVQKLPPPHYRTLEYLMRHLANVAKHGSSTGMTTRNVAIVWAPNLLRCAELEVGGVAALQGVGVQAVVTEFLICYSELIFCDHLPYLDQQLPSSNANDTSPKRTRPKSLAISTPTKLITLEEARSKHLLNRIEDPGYIEVGGGPNNLPKEYHTIIELPHRKRGHSKRSPWRSFFSKSRNSSSQGALNKNRKATTPGGTNATLTIEKFVTDNDLVDVKRKLRTVKSAESLTSGHSEPAVNDNDILGPLHTLNKAPGHNRSVSHDSYFDTLQNSQNNSEGSLLDLSEIQMNFELEESEMRIFSEDESLVSSPRMPKESQRRILTRARPEEFNSATNSGNPSPKKQARVVISPDSMSRKRTRLEDQLSDIQYIDCNTPENNVTVSTTVEVHASTVIPCGTVTSIAAPDTQPSNDENESYRPKNKSPRSSTIDGTETKRQSLNLESAVTVNSKIPKSLTEANIVDKKSIAPLATTPTPQSPNYRQLIESSAATTPAVSPQSPQLIKCGVKSPVEQEEPASKKSPKYENVLTTISITFKSPVKVLKSPRNEASIYEEVLIVNPEKAVVPTSTASLPVQQALVPKEEAIDIKGSLKIPEQHEQRPKSLSALDDGGDANPSETFNKSNSNPSTIHGNYERRSKESLSSSRHKLISSSDDCCTVSSSKSSGLNLSDVQTAILHGISSSSNVYRSMIENADDSPTDDLSLSEINVTSSHATENYRSSQSSLSFPISPSQLSPNVSPCTTATTNNAGSSELLNITTTQQTPNLTPSSTNESLQLNNKGASECSLITNDNLTSSGDLIDTKSSISSSCSNLNLLVYDNFVPNLIQFSPTETSADKQQTGAGSNTAECEEDIYQQVKYYRRSIHEINALLDLDGADASKADRLPEEEQNASETMDSEEKSFEAIDENASNTTSTGSDRHLDDTSAKFDTNEIFVDEKRTATSGPGGISLHDSDDKLESTDKNATFVDSDVYEDLASVKSAKMTTTMKSNESLNNIENLQCIECDSLNSVDVVYENVKFVEPECDASPERDRSPTGKVDVKSLANVFEVKGPKSNAGTKVEKSAQQQQQQHFLPPCLRARNSKHAIKTRSLDEDEFKREFEKILSMSSLAASTLVTQQRRKSLEDAPTYALSLAPKKLNEPKRLPDRFEDDEKANNIHLIHSTESLLPGVADKNLNRERIEKYKEERRKYLHDKYRSESFKEDKDVLLSRFKVFKNSKDESIKEEPATTATSTATKFNKLDRRKNSTSEEEVIPQPPQQEQQLIDTVATVVHADETNKSSAKDKPLYSRESFRLRAAKFETNQMGSFNARPKPINSTVSGKNPSATDAKTKINVTSVDSNKQDDANVLPSDVLRIKRNDDEVSSKNRRHTFDTRERERDRDAEWNKRSNSVMETKPKKEKTSPSYCIKDMKAIFESKSQQ